mgnify:CR=1 FL=1
MDVNLIELINMYRNKLDKDRYSCLLFALQLPSICSRIEYPNSGKYTVYYYDDGRPKDSKLYRKWIKDHYSYFDKITKCFNAKRAKNAKCANFEDIVYDLRCNMTHACVTVDIDKLFNIDDDDCYFCFIDDYDFRETSLSGLGDVRFVSIYDFCQCMFNAASTIDVHNISPSSKIYMSYSDYNELALKYINKCQECLIKYSDEAVLLLGIYEQIKLRKPELLDEMDRFFKENPDGVYNYRQVRNSGPIRIFNVAANLILTRDQYDRMKLIQSVCSNFKECAR